MPQTPYPSSVMYTTLKELGVNMRQAAGALMRTELTFDRHPLLERIEDSSQLSRRIVHVAPESIPASMFRDFAETVPELAERIDERYAVEHCGGDLRQAALELATRLDAAHEKMLAALSEHAGDAAPYANTLSCIARLQLEDPRDTLVLHVLLLVAAGCLGDARAAASHTARYSSERLNADFDTAATEISAIAQQGAAGPELSLGLVRIVDGKVKAGSRLHALDPRGTEIGLLPETRVAIADVDADVSRRHARIWRYEGSWYIEGMRSTNGTLLIRGDDRSEHVVEPARSKRDESYTPQALELHPTDLVCLGATTRFMVMPVID